MNWQTFGAQDNAQQTETELPAGFFFFLLGALTCPCYVAACGRQGESHVGFWGLDMYTSFSPQALIYVLND